MFLIMIAFGMCAAYLFLFYTLPHFFNQPRARLNSRSVYSLIGLLIVSVIAYAISFMISDLELGNRFLHAIGGGFVAALMFYLVAHDTHISLTRFQYFGSSMLVVIALGVLNEHVEFLLQTITPYTFTPHITDTWLDLASNTSGALLGTLIGLMRIHKS